jgi:hypothetical protein
LFDVGVRRLLVVAAAGVLAVGCGSAENEPNLAAAVGKTEAAGSSRIEMSGTESQSGASLECRGEADYAGARLALDCDWGTTGMLELIGIGNVTYMRGDTLGIAGAGSKWLELRDVDESAAAALSPRRLLSMLRDASTETQRVGEEVVRGADTVHYRLEVDCELAELHDCKGPTTPVDVWIAEDGLVRRIALEAESDEVTVEFYDFGMDVAIVAPPPDQVVDVDDFEPRSCKGGGSPIDAGMVVGALRDAGLESERGRECVGGTVQTVGGAHAEDGGPAVFFMCYLSESPPQNAGTATSVLSSATGVQLRLANLSCNVYAAGGGAPSAENVDRLRAAFDDLARRIRP